MVSKNPSIFLTGKPDENVRYMDEFLSPHPSLNPPSSK